MVIYYNDKVFPIIKLSGNLYPSLYESPTRIIKCSEAFEGSEKHLLYSISF